MQSEPDQYNFNIYNNGVEFKEANDLTTEEALEILDKEIRQLKKEVNQI